MLKAVISGGSIGGLSSAHALLRAGVDVLVFEKASSVSAAGAGLGLDCSAEAAIASFGLGDQFHDVAQPMRQEINAGVNNERRRVIAAEDSAMNINSTHWADIHGMLKDALPAGVLQNGHRVLDVTDDTDKVNVTIENEGGEESHSADFLVAADGSMSEIRAKFLPEEPRRYSGYCAWRGVLQQDEHPEVLDAIKSAYPEIGDCLFFDMTNEEGHAVLYELPGKRLNWLWYVNQAEPKLQGTSVTQKADDQMILEMHQKADHTFPAALAKLMKVWNFNKARETMIDYKLSEADSCL